MKENKKMFYCKLKIFFFQSKQLALYIYIFSFRLEMSHLQLLDLPAEILFLIFRHVPLKDKLHILFKIPEFRPFLEDRASYLDIFAPFSLKYIEILRRLRPGWYFSRASGFKRFYLMINETTLHITKIDFYIDGSLTYSQPGSSAKFFHHTIEKFEKYFLETVRHNFEYFEGQELLTYRPGYNFIVVHNDPFSKFKKIYLSEIKKDLKWFEEPKIWGCSKLTFNQQKKLIARCLHPNSCQCENTVQKFDPITLELTTDYKYLILNEGKRIPYWRFSDYRLVNDQYIEEFRKF